MLVSDDWGGEECTVAWTRGNDKDIPVHSLIFFPLPTFLQGQIALRLWLCMKGVCVRAGEVLVSLTKEMKVE